MMRKVNVLAAVANASCLFGSSKPKITPTPSEGAIQYIHTAGEVESLLQNKEDVLVIVTAPFHCPPCEAVKKMFKENEKALLAMQGKGVQIRFNDPAYQDNFTHTWEKGTLMRDSLVGPAIRSYPSLLWFKSEGDVSDAGRNVDFNLLKRMPDQGKMGVYRKVEQWTALVNYVSERRAKVEKQDAEMKKAMPFDQTAVPADFDGFVIFVDNDENRFQKIARNYAVSYNWTKAVEGLGHGPLLFVKNTEKAGQVAYYKGGEEKMVRRTFVPQTKDQPLEHFVKLIRDITPKTPVLASPEPEAEPEAAPEANEPESEPEAGEKVEEAAKDNCEGDQCSA